jgi:hypothetical protein
VPCPPYIPKCISSQEPAPSGCLMTLRLGEDGPMEVPVLGGSLCSITQLGFLAQKRYTRRDHRINTKKRDIP